MNIRILSDEALHGRSQQLARREREILSEILEHLREIDRRKLFSAFGYKSLFEYAVKEFSYSEDQAYRRINAMRLLKELPEVEKKISDGSISLSALSVATSLFKAEAKYNIPFSKDRKLLIVNALQNKSRR